MSSGCGVLTFWGKGREGSRAGLGCGAKEGGTAGVSSCLVEAEVWDNIQWEPKPVPTPVSDPPRSESEPGPTPIQIIQPAMSRCTLVEWTGAGGGGGGGSEQRLQERGGRLEGVCV